MSIEMRDVGGSSPQKNLISDRGAFVDENGYLVKYTMVESSENATQAFYSNAKNREIFEGCIGAIMGVFEEKVKKNQSIKASIDVPYTVDESRGTFEAQAITDQGKVYQCDQSTRPTARETGYGREMLLAAMYMQGSIHSSLQNTDPDFQMLPSSKEQLDTLKQIDDTTLEKAIPKTEGRRLKRYLGMKREASTPVMTLKDFKTMLYKDSLDENEKKILSDTYDNFIKNQQELVSAGKVRFTIEDTPIKDLSNEDALAAYETFSKESSKKLDDFMTALKEKNLAVYQHVQQATKYQEPPTSSSSSSG